MPRQYGFALPYGVLARPSLPMPAHAPKRPRLALDMRLSSSDVALGGLCIPSPFRFPYERHSSTRSTEVIDILAYAERRAGKWKVNGLGSMRVTTSSVTDHGCQLARQRVDLRLCDIGIACQCVRVSGDRISTRISDKAKRNSGIRTRELRFGHADTCTRNQESGIRMQGGEGRGGERKMYI